MPSPSSMLLDADVIAFFKHDETSGTVVGDVTGNYPLTAGASSTIVTGQVGHARDFSGAGNSGTYSDFDSGAGDAALSTALSTGDFTIEALIKPAQTGGDANGCIFSLDRAASSATSGALMIVHSGGTNHLSFYDTGAGNPTDTTTAFADGSWVHVAARFTGTTLDLFVNGALVATFTGLTRTTFGSGFVILLGNRYTASNRFKGVIDEVRVSKVARADADILQSYQLNFGIISPPGGARSHSAQDDAVFGSRGQATWYRTDVQDDGGAWNDLDALRPGRSFLSKVDYGETQDQPIATATVSVARELFRWSMAPFMTGSALNQLGGGTQLLRPGARLRIYSQLQPSGHPPDPAAWTPVFDGRIDKPSSGRDPISLACSDLSIDLERAWIIHERAYGVWQPGQRAIADASAGAVIVPPPNDPTYPQNVSAPTGPWFRATAGSGVMCANHWATGVSTANGTVRTPTVPTGFSYVSSGGTHNTGPTEPIWPTVVGGTVADGSLTWTCQQPTPPAWPNVVGNTVADNGITWTCIEVAGGTLKGTPVETQIQMVLDDNLGVGAWPLFTPAASGEVVRAYVQAEQTVLDAINKLAILRGWPIRWRWDDNSSAFRLTFYNPLRSNTVIAQVIGPGKYRPIEVLDQDLTPMRNWIDVHFWDGVNVDASGNPVLGTATAKDQTSIDEFGESYAAVTVGDGVCLTEAAAQGMADAILSDLNMVPLEMEIMIEFAWWLLLGNLITLQADGRHFDVDQTLAVFSLHHGGGQGAEATTKIGLRGKPSAGFLRWHDQFGLPGLNGGPVKKLSIMGAKLVAANVTKTIAGASLSWEIPADHDYKHTEVHVSTVSPFTPSANTLAATPAAGRFDFGSGAKGSAQTGTLLAGATYYVRTQHVTRAGKASPPSPHVTVTTGYTDLAHVNPNITQNAAGELSADQSFTNASPYVVPLDTELVDQGAIFNPATGVFTLTHDGSFLVQASVTVNGGVAGADVALLKVQTDTGGGWVTTRESAFGQFYNFGGVTYCQMELSFVKSGMLAGDKLRLLIDPGPAGGAINWTVVGQGGNPLLTAQMSVTQLLAQ